MTGIIITSIICGTIVALAIIGTISNHLKTRQASKLTKTLTDEISAKIKANRDKK